MSIQYRIRLNKLCKKFEISEDFINPTLRYLDSHRKLRPKLGEKFIKKLENSKRIQIKTTENLSINTKIYPQFMYYKLKRDFKDKLIKDKKMQNHLKKILRKKFIQSKILKNISNALKIEWSEVMENIEEAKNWRRDVIKKPNLKVSLHSKEGVRVRMRINGDGGIDKKGYILYYNDDKNSREQFSKDIKRLIGRCNIIENGSKMYVSKTASAVLLKALKDYPRLKIQKDIGIDRDILNAAPILKSEALKVYFGDEGRFHSNAVEIVRSKDMSYLSYNKFKEIIKNPRKHSIEAPRFLLDIRNILKEFKIEASEPYFYKNDLLMHADNYGILRLSVGWRLLISGEENLTSFHKKIGFGIKEKDIKLKQFLDKIRVHKARRNNAWLLALENCKKTEKRNGYVTVLRLSKISHRSIRQARRWIEELKKRKLIILAEGRSVKQDAEGKFIAGSKDFRYKLVG